MDKDYEELKKRAKCRWDFFGVIKTFKICVKDIAGHFRRSPMRISQAIIEVEKRLREDRAFRKMVEKLERVLIRELRFIWMGN